MDYGLLGGGIYCVIGIVIGGSLSVLSIFDILGILGVLGVLGILGIFGILGVLLGLVLHDFFIDR